MKLRKRLRKLTSAKARGLERLRCFFKLEQGNYCSTSFISKKITCKFSFLLLTLRRESFNCARLFEVFSSIERLFWRTREKFLQCQKILMTKKRKKTPFVIIAERKKSHKLMENINKIEVIRTEDKKKEQ